MKYFAIQHSLNEKIMGKIPQMKEMITHCHVDDPNFIDNLYFRKIEGVPILFNAVLYANAKLTDLLDVGGTGFSFGSIIISDKLKKILDHFNVYGIQYFQTYIIQKNQKLESYWQNHIYDFPFQYIDFKKTTFILKDRDSNRNVFEKEIIFHNLLEFLDFVNKISYPKMISFNSIFFTPEMNLDYFSLRFSNAHQGIVSEKLKDEIEAAGCTGIEFQPSELSYNEWVAPGGEREKIYGKI